MGYGGGGYGVWGVWSMGYLLLVGCNYEEAVGMT